MRLLLMPRLRTLSYDLLSCFLAVAPEVAMGGGREAPLLRTGHTDRDTTSALVAGGATVSALPTRIDAGTCIRRSDSGANPCKIACAMTKTARTPGTAWSPAEPLKRVCMAGSFSHAPVSRALRSGGFELRCANSVIWALLAEVGEVFAIGACAACDEFGESTGGEAGDAEAAWHRCGMRVPGRPGRSSSRP